MRTNVVVDDELIRDAKELAGVRTMREAIDLALREFVAHRRRLRFLEMGGTGWEGDLDAMRHHER